MDRVKALAVHYHDRHVGTLALYQNRFAAFEYSREWLSDGFSISPFSLPLKKRVFIPEMEPFEGIFGVFADSIPDGWGRLLLDRLMRRNGIDPACLGNLDRLAIVGGTGMGALTYRPVISLDAADMGMALDEIAAECEKLLQDRHSDNLDTLFAKGGSSGGARPKILTKVDGEDWIIKFPSSDDSRDIGKQEYDYTACAAACGIEIAPFRLFDSEKCSGYFGMKRFDRTGSGEDDRVHMVSVSGLLETSHRIPSLDYDSLMRLTLQLTKDMGECEKMYRRMCFNVFAHNRDDHSRNFSYLYKEGEERWVLSPAYDLTYSNSLGGEHATMVHGNGASPGMRDVLEVARDIGISPGRAKAIAGDIRECVAEKLGEYVSIL